MTLLAVAGVNYIMGIPGSDDIMLNYQTTSFHDALYVRKVLGLKPAPEFEDWLKTMGIYEQDKREVRLSDSLPKPFQRALAHLALRRAMARETRDIVVTDPWTKLRQYTDARIALGRSGTSLPTKPHLEFQLAHARARDAVHHELDVPAFAETVRSRGFETVLLHSAAESRSMYLQRPDKGRRLDAQSRASLEALPRPAEPYDAVVRHRRRALGARHRRECRLVSRRGPADAERATGASRRSAS